VRICNLVRLIMVMALCCLALGQADFPKAQATSAAKGTLADSVANFSSTQGHAHWLYGYYTSPGKSASFTKFPYFVNRNWTENPQFPSAPWTSLSADGGHPNATNSGLVHWAVRRWISQVSGAISISGVYVKETGALGGDGTTGHILVNGKQTWSHNVAGSDAAGVRYAIVARVSVGSVVDFAIDPNSNDLYDSTKFTAVIAIK